MITHANRPFPLARANLEYPKVRAPASAAASLTMMFNASMEPACAENASGMSICDGASVARAATTTATGISAATAPSTVISQ